MKTPYEVLTEFFDRIGKDADIYRFEAGVHYGSSYTYKITLDDGRIYYWNIDRWEIKRWEPT